MQARCAHIILSKAGLVFFCFCIVLLVIDNGNFDELDHKWS